MRRDLAVVSLVIVVLFTSGCVDTGNIVYEDSIKENIPKEPKIIEEPKEEIKIVCNKPYILVGVSCCLDKNDNKICDIDERKSEELNECLIRYHKYGKWLGMLKLCETDDYCQKYAMKLYGISESRAKDDVKCFPTKFEDIYGFENLTCKDDLSCVIQLFGSEKEIIEEVKDIYRCIDNHCKTTEGVNHFFEIYLNIDSSGFDDGLEVVWLEPWNKWRFYSNKGELRLDISNNQNFTVKIVSIKATYENQTFISNIRKDYLYSKSFITPGKTGRFYVSGFQDLKIGDPYEVDIEITYENTEIGIEYKTKGSLKGNFVEFLENEGALSKTVVS